MLSYDRCLPTPNQPPPCLTLKGLRYIRQEVNSARHELLEILRLGGDVRAIWGKPWSYFEPEEGTLIPIPNEELNRLLKPIWNECDLADPVRWALLGDIFNHRQFFEFARRELIPERFM